MATGISVSDYWDELAIEPMLEELDYMPSFAIAGRRYGKAYTAMYVALYPGPAVGDDEPAADTSGYARSPWSTCTCGKPATDAVHRMDGPCYHHPSERASALEHPPLQVAFFDEEGKEPIRDPSYRRMLVKFERNGDFMVNAEAIPFPAATRNWGVIDEARIFDEEGNELFSCDISHPLHVSAGCLVCFRVGELRLSSQAWESQMEEDDKNYPESSASVHRVGSKEISLRGETKDSFFFSETAFTDFAPDSSRELKADTGPMTVGGPLSSGLVSAFKKAYGGWIDPLPEVEPMGALTREKIEKWAALIAARREKLLEEHGFDPSPCGREVTGPSGRKYNFPVVAQLEHGQTEPGTRHAMTLNSPDAIPYPVMSDELRRTLQGDSPLNIDSRQAQPLLSEPYRNFIITGIDPGTPTESPSEPPAPEKAPEPEEDDAAIRAHNLRIMFGGG